MINETDSKWSPKKWLTWAIFLDLSVLSCLLLMPLLPFIQDTFKLIYLTIIHWLRSMSTLFRRWKSRLRCSSKRYIHRSRSSIVVDNEFKTVNVTIEKLSHENQILKERFEKLEDRCQRWITDEQIYLLKRIEQLEEDNRRLHETSEKYQKQSEKCLESVTDLIIKTLFTQEELRKQCTDLHHVIDTVQLRKKNASILLPTTRSISCQYPSNHSNENQRHTTDDQSTWLHQQLFIVEETDPKTAKEEQVSELHLTESQSSVYAPTMATAKYKSRIPSIGLANELYFSSHKPDGDQEQTSPVPLRNKRRSPHLNHTPVDNTPSLSTNRRPISSPVRSTTYVLQQHHRLTNNTRHHPINKTCASPVQQQSASQTSVTLNRTRQTQQQRTYSNHERLPAQTTLTVDSSTTTPQLSTRAHTALTARRTSPIVKTTPTKPVITTSSYTSRSPRIPNTPPVRPSRTSAPSSSSPATQQRAPRVQPRPSNLTPTTQRTVSASPTINKAIPRQSTPSKSPEQLRSVTGTVTHPRPAHMLVNKSKISTNSNKTRTLTSVPPVVITPSTARVSDLDVLMEQKHLPTSKKPSNIQLKASVITPSPIANHFRRSLFSTDSVKVVRPVRSQELKIFSSHLTTEQPPPLLPIISDQSTMDETLSTLTPSSFEKKSLEEPNGKNDDSSSNTSALLRDLSDDSLNSLNEHYHIRQLLKSNASAIVTKNDSTQNNSSSDDIPVTSWSRIRSSCESNISHIVPLQNESSASPAFYQGPVRQENIQMAGDGRYFFLIDENLSSEENRLSATSSSSRSVSPPIKLPVASTDRKSFAHRLVFPARLGRVIFYRRVLSDSDIYQKLCSKDNEINHNVYHLDTIRDYAMEFYMLTTYGSDSQLRAWFDHHSDDFGNNTCYFDDNRFQSFDDDDDDDDDEERNATRLKRSGSSDSIIRTDDFNRIQADEELDWYSELESFNFLPNNSQWKQENVSSCSSDDHVGDLLRAEQFSVSSLTTTTSADSSSSTGLISASWPLTNGIHYQIHSNRSSQSLGSPQLSNIDDQSNTILKEILTYPWTNDFPTSNLNPPPEIGSDSMENDPSSSLVVSEEFQPDFYYLCPLKNTSSFRHGDEKSNGFSHDV